MDNVFRTFPPAQWRDITVLVAVSGGADSVAILRALYGISEPGDLGRLAVAHFNHGWRGEASDGDALFVESLAASLGLECYVGGPPVAPSSTGRSEATARDLRYAFLTETAKAIGARYLVTAHSRDDQVETILHRILRGTGLRGLAGVPRFRVIDESLTVVRPLLDTRRHEIEHYLQEIGQAFRIDDSNLDVRYLRNRLRNELLPLLRDDYHAEIDQSLLRLAQIACDVQSDLNDRLVKTMQQAVTFHPDHVLVDCQEMRPCSRHLARELAAEIWRQKGWPMQEMGFERLDELATFLIATGPTRVTMYPGRVRVEVQDDNKLRLSRPN